MTSDNVSFQYLDDILLKDTALRALAPTPVRDHLSVFNWIYGEKPLDKDQYDFIYHQDDFVSLSGKPQKGFDNLIEAYLNRSYGSRIQVESILSPFHYPTISHWQHGSKPRVTSALKLIRSHSIDEMIHRADSSP